MISNFSHWAALAGAIVLNVVANVELKLAVQSSSHRTGFSVIRDLLTGFHFWLGAIAATGLLALYLYAVRELSLGIAYPTVTGGAMVGLAAASQVVFGQNLRVDQLMGIALIVLGITLLSRP